MISNYSHGLAATQPVRIEHPALNAPGLLTRFFDWVRQVFCGFRGHDMLLRFDAQRVLLVCASCGHESPGWDVGQRRPRVRFAGDAKRHALHPAPVLVRRKSA
jgi:hypothetical protein